MTDFLNNYVPGLKYGAKILNSEVLGGGVPFTFGKVFYVDYDDGVDTNDGLSPQSAFKTIAYAYTQMADGDNDVLVLSASASHVVKSMITIAKNKVHFIGAGVGFRKYGQRAKVTMGITTATTDIAIIANVGTGNTFSNIKFATDNTLTQGAAAVAEGGQYSSYSGCEFYNSTHLNSATAAELLLNGDSAQFFNCTFGSIADAVVGDVVRPAVYMAGSSILGSYAAVSRDVLFEGCNFWKNAGGTTTTMIKLASDNDLERYMEIKDCSFVANKLGSVPAVAVSSPTLTKSQINLTGSTSSANCTKLATATGIISSLPARVATATIGIQTT